MEALRVIGFLSQPENYDFLLRQANPLRLTKNKYVSFILAVRTGTVFTARDSVPAPKRPDSMI